VDSKPKVQQKAANALGVNLVDYWSMGNQSGPHTCIVLNPAEKPRLVAAGVDRNLPAGLPWQYIRFYNPVNAEYKDGTFGNREGAIKSYHL
jgi:hypothetical protein